MNGSARASANNAPPNGGPAMLAAKLRASFCATASRTCSLGTTCRSAPRSQT
jgi:hypothetical protein